MLTLTLFRHAKSSWDHPGLSDFDRPLSARGAQAAPKMGAWLAAAGLVPDLVLCSSSRRTMDTLALALPCWTPAPMIEYLKALYLAEVPALLAIARDAPPGTRHLMLIGHNPGFHSFARRLAGDGDPEARQALAVKFPTAAMAIIDFDAAGWQAIEPGAGHLRAFIMPKQLAAD